MFAFLVGCALGAAVVVCLGAPFFAPWPIRLSYLLTAPLADPVLGFGLGLGLGLGLGETMRLSMRVVVLTEIGAARGQVVLALCESRRGRTVGSETFACAGCPPSMIAKLDGWLAMQTPLLLIVDGTDETHLYGPDGVVTYLEHSPEKIR